MIGRPQARQVVAFLARGEGEVTGVHLIRVVDAIAIRRSHLISLNQTSYRFTNTSIENKRAIRVRKGRGDCYPDGDLVGIRERGGIGGVDDGVLADGHGVDLYVLGDALRVARMKLEPQCAGWRCHRKERRQGQG